ncbi:hypothetical protein [Magnetospira sp. QH-2]|uniref:hypothetical protein n=1 Tax=Magnetospira sp. (strain QH-2) TaxID=1288970 RepID=UPI0003E81333|nr:hypothetical protein [Magnetospira sp. QH-2]CCQ74140.1 Protein of unknown function [Magnetospira sp. QH-2]
MPRTRLLPDALRAPADAAATSPPRKTLAKGMVDWEIFFEAKDQGVIPLVKQARSLDTLEKCYAVTVAQLFRRDGDSDRRRTFEALFHELVGAGEQDLEAIKERLTLVFRHIKEERKERVDMLLKAKASKAEEEERRATEAQVDLDEDESVELETPMATSPDEPEGPTAREAFKEVFAQLFINRLMLMEADMDWCQKNHVKPPFFCSPDFSALFKQALIDHLGDAMADHFPSLLTRIKLKEPDDRLAYTLENLEDRKYRRVLWETWQGVWARVTQEQVAPKKPSPEKQKKKGFLESLTGQSGDKKGDSIAGWKKKVAAVKEHNANCVALWEIITDTSTLFVPPTKEDDGKMLMQLFGRSMSGLKKEITALRQIAGQGGELGRAFDRYQAGKSLDLSLTVVSFQAPDLYQDDHKKILKKYLAGIPAESRASAYPLTTRFLGEFLN